MHVVGLASRIVGFGALLGLAACGGGGGGGSTPSFSVGGTVSGVVGSGLILQLNGGSNAAIGSNGGFTFTTPVARGASYTVTALAQPLTPSQTCTVTNGTGTVGGDISNVTVTCVTNSFNVGVSVTGLMGSGLVLVNNGTDTLALSANGAGQFARPVSSGTGYDVRILTQPVDPPQACTVSSGVGTVGNGAVGLSVACVTPVPRFAASLDFNDSSYSTYVVDAASGQLRPRGFGRTGRNPVAVAADSTGTRALVLSRGDATLSSFARDQVTGALKEAPGSPYATGASALPVTATDGANTVTAHPRLGFVYVPTGNGAGAGSNKIAGFAIAATGALSPIPNSPFAAGVAPFALTIDANGRFAYATNRISNDINVYSIDQGNGALVETVTARVALAAGASPGTLLLHPNGRFAYLTNSGTGTVSVFTVASTSGALTQVTGSPFAVGPNPAVAPLLHPSGRFLYVRSINTQGQNGTIAAFAVDQASGVLTALGTPLEVGANTSAQALDPAGRFLLVASRGSNPGAGESGAIAAFRVDADGSLVRLAGVADLTPAPFSVSVDPSGRFVYSASAAGNIHRSYVLGTDGSLTPLARSAEVASRDQPVSLTAFPASSNPSAPAVFASRSAFVPNRNDNTISSYDIDASTGALTTASVTFAGAASPTTLVVHPSSRFLLGGNDSPPGSLSSYRIDAATGALAPMALSTLTTGRTQQSGVAVDPNGRTLYVAQFFSDSGNTPSIAAVNVDPVQGTLSAIDTGISLLDTGLAPRDVEIGLNGKVAYYLTVNDVGFARIDQATGGFTAAAGNVVPQTANNKMRIALSPNGLFAYVLANNPATLEVYGVTPAGMNAGALTLLASREIPTNTFCFGLTIDPAGRFIYVAEGINNTLITFAVQPSGNDVALVGSPLPVGLQPIVLRVDYSGKFLYVLSSNRTVTTLAIDQATGGLMRVGPGAPTGMAPLDLALSADVR